MDSLNMLGMCSGNLIWIRSDANLGTFPLCYFFLTTTVILTNVCLFTIWVLTLAKSVKPATNELLLTTLQNETDHFCALLEPKLPCQIPLEGYDDFIAEKCLPRTVQASEDDCSESLTLFLNSYLWLPVVSLEGLILMGFGIVVLIRSCMVGYVQVPEDIDDSNLCEPKLALE
ncbi:hypothetical protein L596_026460 [Steinernema carpocapsae]|uniref:Uncharacterized protein n=1 Tax=Steinernema carpocapsae TaxID=34508 RepID=A0A4U5M1I1_STECR|nr:hypothetical protein L596_026460 [Steinernema carpocapsae]